MPYDISSIQLPPPGAKLRLPPTSSTTYEEAYAQVRRHLKDDGKQATMSVQMKSQVQAIHAEPVRVGASD
jgi:hypothetical protein